MPPEPLYLVAARVIWWLGLAYVVWVRVLGGSTSVGTVVAAALKRLRVRPANYPLARDSLVLIVAVTLALAFPGIIPSGP